ncbi:hypothetical protein GCM10010912_07330 [Paenibacillus albidus]|uniref:Transposase DDE domain-containing protein n=1 Tax=Paenibacillus albidus TaxID=2041023 RepID=A0A917BZF7_9BACL|nr:hypothetical protein GCM10010912_07330 [Paenibacillus albidus]
MSVRRMTELESVFGQLKNNREFRRFWRWYMDKVSLEVGWLSLAHNLLKQDLWDIPFGSWKSNTNVRLMLDT